MAARHNWGMYFPSFGAWEAAYGGYYAIVEATKPPPFPGFKGRKISTPFGEVTIATNAHPCDVTKWVKIGEGKFFANRGVRKSHSEKKMVTDTHIAKLGDTMWDDDVEYTTSTLVDVVVDDGEVAYSDLGAWGIDLDQEFLALEQEIDVLMAHHNRYRYGMPLVHLPEFETLRLAAIEEARASSSADAYGILMLVATQDERDSWQEARAPAQVKPAVKGKVTTVADCDRPESPFAALKGKFK